jgi:hypothetical protein
MLVECEEILTDPDKLEDEEDIDEKDLDEENKHVKILEKIENFKSLDKQKLIFPMIGTIQKLIKIINEQDERIKKLESK